MRSKYAEEESSRPKPKGKDVDAVEALWRSMGCKPPRVPGWLTRRAKQVKPAHPRH